MAKIKTNNNSSRLILCFNEFAKAHNLKMVKLYLVENRLQNLKSDTCVMFQL